jgi:choline-sulfatase
MRVNRREFLGAAALSAAADAMQRPAGRQPNILFICCDNLNPNVLGCAGHPMVKTPNIDRMAARGTYFTNAYCSSPVCVPARSGLFSGVFPSDVDSYCNATPFQVQRQTWGHMLREAGYYTKATGKMDLASKKDLGFDQELTANEHDAKGGDITALFRRPLCYRLGEREDIEGRVVNREHKDVPVMKVGLKFLREDAPKRTAPWLLYVGYISPLPGFQVEREFAKLYPPGKVPVAQVPADYFENIPEPWEATRAYKRISTPIPEARIRRALSAYYGNVTALDHRVGQILDQLDRSGMRDHTVVIFTSDHGRSLGEHGLWFHNEPTDNSARVPIIMTGPGIPQGKRIGTPVAHVDLFPTLAALSGAAAPSGLRGHSLLPLLAGRTGDHPGYAYSELHAEGTCTGSFTIRKGKWKYIHYSYYDSLLFNMETDPGEMKNLIDTDEGKRAGKELHEILVSLVNPDTVTERAFAVQEKKLQDLCSRYTLDQLLENGFEQRLGRGQATTLLKKYIKARA